MSQHRISFDAALNEIKDEIAKRRTHYPKMIAKGTIKSQVEAEKRIAMLEHVSGLMEALKGYRADPNAPALPPDNFFQDNIISVELK